MKTGTLVLLGVIGVLAVKSGALGRLASAAPDVTPGGGGDPVDSPIEVVVPETIHLNYNPNDANNTIPTKLRNPIGEWGQI
jgi:hypothetical protein